jgi:hypothetical protein
VEIGKCGNVKMWKCGNWEIGKCENVEMMQDHDFRLKGVLSRAI